MTALGLTLSVAESCTGGLIAHRITEIPGASAFFQLGVVAYSDSSKVKLLGVREATLRKSGAVSEAVAGEMAVGASRAGNSVCSIGITGIAGPAGGTPEKPVGTVFIAFYWSGKGVPRVQRVQLHGDRSTIQEEAATHAVCTFLSFIDSLK